MTRRALVPLLLVLVAGCSGATRVVRLETGQDAPTVVPPRSGEATPVTLNETAFEAALAKRAREVRPPTHAQEAARRLFELEARSGAYLYEARNRRLTPLGPGESLDGERPSAEVELTRAYLRWCERTARPGDCLGLLVEGSTVNGDGRYALAMALAQGVVLDAMLESFRDMADPQAMLRAVLWTWTTYMILLAVPEPFSKGVAAVMTVSLIGYVGLETFWSLIDGFKRLVDAADQATTFDELREAGERYGKVMGRNAARAFALLAAAAVGNTTAGLAAKVPTLPGAAQAAAQAGTQVGVRLAAVGEVRSVAVSAGAVTISLAPGAVAMAAHDDGGGAPGTAPARSPPITAPADVRPPAARHYARQVDQRTVAKELNSVMEPRVDVNADIAAIKAGRAQVGRTTGGDLSYTVNGRTYGAHPNGTLYPVQGDGIHVLNRGSFKALGVYNPWGNTPRAEQILDKMGVGAGERANALTVWKRLQ